MRARVVPAEALHEVQGCEWRDPARGIHLSEGRAYVPVRSGFPFDLEIGERSPYAGRGYQRLGEIVVVRGNRPTKEELEAILAWEQPRGVVWIRGHEGVLRRPLAEVIHGECGEVVVREHGCTYLLDPSRVMFSKGNRVERQRIASLVRASGREERVADMCAGIGYFAIPIALSGARVHAMELNPEAFAYLVKNVQANRVGSRVCAELGDSRELLHGAYDRFVIGHFDSLSFLPEAIAHAGAGTTIHLHTTGDARDAIAGILEAHGIRSYRISMRRVKKTGPHSWHMVQDVVLG